MKRIIDGIQHFQRHVFPTNRELFQRLARGQNPEALVIACSDSRVSLEWITQCVPGDLFVCRNAGNMVPPYSQTDAVSASIEYAVSALQIKHIVVCGHSDCGAMKSLLAPEALSEMPEVKAWLRHGAAAQCALVASGDPVDSLDTASALTKLNVRLQLDHLRTHPQVFSRLRAGDLELHGWVYRIDTGEVLDWDRTKDAWVAIHEATEDRAWQRSAQAEVAWYA